MLKNAYSNSALPNIFSAIEKTLSSHGAKQIVRDYNGQGKVSVISFVIDTKQGLFMFRMPAEVERVKRVFEEQGFRCNPEQPYRTAWATIRDWVEIQMALVDWGQAKTEQAFLSYAVGKDGQTFFEAFENGKLLLGSGDKPEGGTVI